MEHYFMQSIIKQFLLHALILGSCNIVSNDSAATNPKTPRLTPQEINQYYRKATKLFVKNFYNLTSPTLDEEDEMIDFLKTVPKNAFLKRSKKLHVNYLSSACMQTSSPRVLKELFDKFLINFNKPTNVYSEYPIEKVIWNIDSPWEQESTEVLNTIIKKTTSRKAFHNQHEIDDYYHTTCMYLFSKIVTHHPQTLSNQKKYRMFDESTLLALIKKTRGDAFTLTIFNNICTRFNHNHALYKYGFTEKVLLASLLKISKKSPLYKKAVSMASTSLEKFITEFIPLYSYRDNNIMNPPALIDALENFKHLPSETQNNVGNTLNRYEEEGALHRARQTLHRINPTSSCEKIYSLFSLCAIKCGELPI